MRDVAEFPFIVIKNLRDETTLRPLVPVTLSHGGQSVQVSGLLDTGADVNVLPYDLGIQLGGNWEQARTGLQLSGNLARYEARGTLISCVVGHLPPVQLAFAWTQAENVPLLFGQINFFAEFDVCFLRTRSRIEVRHKTLP